MKAKIVGLSMSKGTFEGFDYDNIVLHGTCDADGMVAGQLARTFKLKRSHFEAAVSDIKCPQPVHVPEDLRQLVGHEVRMYLDGKYVDEIYFLK